MSTWFRLLTVCSLLSLVAGCGTATPVPTKAPASTLTQVVWPGKNWQTSTPEAQGMDSAQLARVLAQIEAQEIPLHSLLIARNGRLVTEVYFYPYTQEQTHAIASVTKSVIGMLVGILIDRGEIKSVNQPVISFFPGRTIAHLDANKKAMTLKHLLSLTSGLECNDAPGSGGQTVEQSADWVQYMLDRPMATAPGTAFNYCTGAVHLLSAIVQQAAGMTAREFANEALFAQVGIAEVPPERWPSDPQGVSTGGYGLSLTPRDMARLGILFLNRGGWTGQQILPQEWIAASTVQQTTKEDGAGYGYLWTVHPDKGYYAAYGLGGQHLYAVPEKNLVVVTTAGIAPPGEQPTLNALLEDGILPAIRSDGALPENAAGQAQLQARLKEAALPVRPVPALPEIANRVSGQTYAMEQNPFGFETLSLVFKEGSDAAWVSVNGDEALPVGLANLYRLSGGNGLTQALRGWWEGRQVFVLENRQLGELMAYDFSLTFDGDELSIKVEDRLFGAPAMTLHGRLQQ